jgi:glycine cleavage system H protein
MNIPQELRYSKEHEWVRVEGNKATVGITDFAQHELGDVVFVELPAAGAAVTAGKQFAVVESVKAVSDIFAPVSGTVTAVNDALTDAPETINGDPYGAGWIAVIEMSDSGELAALLDSAGYPRTRLPGAPAR